MLKTSNEKGIRFINYFSERGASYLKLVHFNGVLAVQLSRYEENLTGIIVW